MYVILASEAAVRTSGSSRAVSTPVRKSAAADSVMIILFILFVTLYHTKIKTIFVKRKCDKSVCGKK